MRQLVVVIIVISSLVLMMQCSENESLSVFNDKMVVVTAPVTMEYSSFLPYIYKILPDSTKWLYECTSGKASRVSIILSGQIETDSIQGPEDTVKVELGQNHIELSVETYTGNNPGSENVNFVNDSTFLDTILIDTSSTSELVLPQNCRFFVKVGEIISDTISVTNPYNDLE